MKSLEITAWILVWSLMILLCLAFMVYSMTAQRWEEEAVEKGRAEYSLDADHTRQWRWKECKR